jgi:O-antigen/teichoic acid export membrane protein
MIESANLKGAAAKGLFWSTAERFGAQGIQFIFGILVTRILSLSDYGLLGMILIFMAIGQTLIDSGFGSALIWKKEATHTDYSTVFYFNISASIGLYLLFYFSAPLVANFYSEPKLIDLIRVICLNFIILSFSLIQQTLLQKRVDFKLMAYVNIGGSLVAGIVALLMAMNDFGVWSLVWQILIKSLVTTIFIWAFSSWRPLFVFNFVTLKELFGYGSKLTISGLIYTIFQYLYFNIIGKLFPIDSLGSYTRASQLQDFPIKTGASIFNRVVFPVFATIQDDNARLRNAVGKTLRTMVFFMFPLIFGLIAVSDQMIVVLLTEKWSPASDYFKLLCLTGLFYIFQVVNGEILKTKGRLDWVLKLEVITKTVMMISVLVTWRWGISAIIYGQMFTSAVAYIVGSYYVRKLIGYSFRQQFNDIIVYFALSVAMYLIVMVISYFVNNPFVYLIIASLTGAVFYFFGALVLKLDEVQEARKILVNLKLK